MSAAALIAAAGLAIGFTPQIGAVFYTPARTPAVTIADLASRPDGDAWRIVHPLASLVTATARVSVTAQTVDQNRSLLFWSSDDGDVSNRLSLLNTQTGGVLWSVDWAHDDAVVASAVGAARILVWAETDDGDVMVSLDPLTGGVTGDTTTLTDVAVLAGSPATRAPELGGDALLQTADGIGRYSGYSLDDPDWFVGLNLSEVRTTSVAGNRLIINDRAYDLATGERVDWVDAVQRNYYDYGGRIVSFENSEMLGFQPDGTIAWRADVQLVPATWRALAIDGDLFVYSDRAAGIIHALDLDTGVERWQSSTKIESSGGSSAFSTRAGLLLVSREGSDGTLSALDLRTGALKFEVASTAAVAVPIAVSPTRIYLADADSDGDSGRLRSFDTTTGQQRWSLRVPNAARLHAAQWAGQIVLVASETSAADALGNPTVIGLQP